jgi:transposase
VKKTLKHESNNVREFYSNLPRPVRVGIEATGSMQWFVNLVEELGSECLVGHPAEIRAAEPEKAKLDQAGCGLTPVIAGRKSFSSDLVIHERTVRPAGLIAPSSSVGPHARENI